MLYYLTLGTNDLARAQRFYDAIMPTIGAARLVTLLTDTASELGYGLAGGLAEGLAEGLAGQPGGQSDVCLWINRPYDGNAATVGNGSMPAFHAPTRQAVAAFYAMALAHGGTCEGAPGLRYAANFYACYVRDPDGNKLSAVCTAPTDPL
jgi:catechol 2,3-dioxygenase-like lactoylglutathione lyase family enzyme